MSRMNNDNVLQINVDEIIKSKNPKLYRFLPGFLIKFLKKLIHQDEINEFLLNNKDKTGLDFVNAVNDFLDIKTEVYGFENVPSDGRFIFAANHPLGGLESMAMMKIIAQKYTKFNFVVNDLLMYLTPMKDIFVPVNKIGGQTREYIEKINALYNSEQQILYFPAGLVSRKNKGIIRDPAWQKSFINNAIKSNRNIILIYIEGKNSKFFYNLAHWRKKLKIKANIEMLFLVNEMFKQRGQTIRLYFGKPILYTFFDKSKSYLEWAKYLQEQTYLLFNKEH